MGKVREIDGDQEDFWRMAIETWQTSGLSVRQFCTNEGLSEPSFYSWRKKLTGGSVQGEKAQSQPSTFIEVTLSQGNPAIVELLLISGNTLRIPAGVDSATLTTILSVVHSTGLC
jgi:transposase